MKPAPPWRLPLWTLSVGAFVGASIVHVDGLDFQLLEPAALAVVLFVAIPTGAAALTATLAERWTAAELWPSSPNGRFSRSRPAPLG